MEVGFQRLPIELLYELQLWALSPSLPRVSRRLFHVFKSASPHFHAQYILSRVCSPDLSVIYTRALRYPLCSEGVLKSIQELLEGHEHSCTSSCELPRRLFRTLIPRKDISEWKRDDPPLPLLRYLYDTPGIPPPDINSHSGYALTRAVHARCIPVVRFLLDLGASPAYKKNLAVIVAIRQKDLTLVKMLVEREDKASLNKGTAKKRKLEDRVLLDSRMLKIALERDAMDIVEYMTQEKGLIPDIQTLKTMMM
ncbi:uncharacterized protein LACBIDRAFT_249631 [Laccaria bicolor S238N-H82]|uniref:Predicted protein n=1 Tax=Laccaria bicolor (strain S238N-H82 / ATCC MYA-4686) TaxID=486041 RepID=B0DAF9_LACBS|nr:uncharacterized protein LACBIDRAFT_249631 [Laccaria bicolor S238N-H82]EDR08526.1 predicted protein [Laccaria bicolor S238N-H82]|eukprot:XP_001880751.1 predicted protein [Laccaria bicolor S238N-H82]